MSSNDPFEPFARRIVASGFITDPWLDGAPRFSSSPVVLQPDEHRALCSTAEDLAAVIDEAILLLLDDPEQLDSFLGLSPTQRLMFEQCAPLWHGFARADVFFTTDGPQITELNSDTPTGEPEAVVLGVLGHEDHPDLVDACASLPSRLLAMCEAMSAQLVDGNAPRVAGIVYPTELTEDLSLVRLLRALLLRAGWQVVLGSPYNLALDDDGALTLFGQPIRLMLRHYKTDWWGERQAAWLDDTIDDAAALREPLHAVLTAMGNRRVAVANPFGAVVAQNKRLLAFLWERVHRFSQRSQSIIERIVPWTSRLEVMHVEQLRADKDAWVLKSDYGAEGNEVIVGRLVDAPTWQRALAMARPGRFVAQRCFEALRDADGRVRNHGVFVVAGEACGVYTRLDAGLTDPAALSVPTLIAPDSGAVDRTRPR